MSSDALFTPAPLWEVGATLGEGPVWDSRTGTVYFVDIKGRNVHACAADGSGRRTWAMPRQPGAIVPVKGGGHAITLEDGVYRFDERSGALTLVCHVEHDQPSNRFNDGHVDAQGCLWFGSMHDPEEESTGSLYRYEADGQVRVKDSDYIITNGPATSPDGRTLYHTDTLKREVYAFDLAADGSLSNKRLFMQVTGSGYPDGMAVDAEGCVWIAHFAGARIERYSPQGELLRTVNFPCSNITKLAFGGDDLKTAFVTTARKGLSAEALAQQPLAGALFVFRTDVPGLAQHEFSLEAAS